MRVELDELDSDLREAFEIIGVNNITPGLPTKIQLNRLLRQILAEIKRPKKIDVVKGGFQ